MIEAVLATLEGRKFFTEENGRLKMNFGQFFNERDMKILMSDGYLPLTSLVPSEEVRKISSILTALYEKNSGFNEGANFDLVSNRDELSVIPTISNPHHYNDELRRIELKERALNIAKQILGPKAYPSFEHTILKPGTCQAETPWHQDEAYRFDPAFEYNQISIWIPLLDVGEANGCMRYVRGSHRHGIVPHRRLNNDTLVHAIECVPEYIDHALVESCPLRAGDAVVHLGRTIHSSGVNCSNKPRLAYILAFETPPERIAGGRGFSWSYSEESRLARQKKWRSQGGVISEILRKARDGVLTQPGRFSFEARRLARAVSPFGKKDPNTSRR